MRRVYTIPLSELAESDYQKCYSLNARQEGAMQGALSLARRNNSKATISLVKEDDLLIGWAFAFKITNRSKYPQCHFYCRKSHRKQGVGKILMGEMLSVYPKIRVSPHNEQSSMFFVEWQTSLVTSRYNRQLLRAAAKKKYS